MKLIKLSGNLLPDGPAIHHIADSLHELLSHLPLIVLVSGKTDTDRQLTSIVLASRIEGFDFSSALAELESGYLDKVRAVVPVTHQSGPLSFIRKKFNDIDDLCKGVQLLGECPAKTLELVSHASAILSSHILHAACQSKGLPSSWHTAFNDAQVPMMVIPDANDAILKVVDRQGKSIQSIEVWLEDMPYHTADPLVVANARPLFQLSHEEAIEFSRHHRDVVPPLLLGKALKFAIPIQLKKAREIENRAVSIGAAESDSNNMISGISSADGLMLLSVEGSGMIGVPGFAKRVFAALHEQDINVVLISQGASEHSICVAVKKEKGLAAREALELAFADEISNAILQTVRFMENVAVLELIGEHMRNHPGVSGRMFSALGRNGINILAIAQGANERNISAVIYEKDRVKALNVLHEAFFENANKEINLFIIGLGNVGRKLMDQLQRQAPMLLETQHIKLVIAGLCNSRTMCIQENGIASEEWESKLATGQKADAAGFTEEMIRLNLRNSVLVDITANPDIPELYAKVLRKSMSVVACNKIAASDKYVKYRELKQLAISYNCKFLFETNVGAALPVIGTLNDLIKSGDRIQSMEAVLSGTLNFVFNNYDGQKSFSSVVRDAQNEGYTEPDPRLDLSGTDVMRKIMILAREAGEPLEMEHITCHPFLPESCMEGSVDDFYAEMEKHESHFKSLLEAAIENGAKLKFVARFENGKASAGLQHIKPESDMFHLYGKDNIVLFKTDRYAFQPLVIKGAGAGAEVTASGVFADIIRTINP